jgi:hypothetical protein
MENKDKDDVPYASEGQPKPKGTMHCSMERATGSNFMQRVCSYADANFGDSFIEDGMMAAQRRALQHVIPRE